MENRKSHIVRVYGKDETPDGGPDNSETWVDMEILDEIPFEGGSILASRSSGYFEQRIHFQDTAISFVYRDGKNLESRYFTGDAKVILGIDDEDLYVIVQTNSGINVDSGQGYQYTEIDTRYHNKQRDRGREGVLARILHNEIDDNFLVPDDNGDLQPPSDPSDYLEAVRESDSSDRDTFINMELIDQYTELSGSGYQYQDVNLRPNWRRSVLLVDDGSGIPGLELGSSDEAIPVRLDPLQNIVNVSSAGLAVEFGDGSGPPPERDRGGGGV